MLGPLGIPIAIAGWIGIRQHPKMGHPDGEMVVWPKN
jgi:hypothetical protein